MTKAQKVEREGAIEEMRKVLRPGDTVWTKLVHVARSGMMRVIDVYVIRDNEPLRFSWSVAHAIGFKYNRKHEGVEVGGCGMDVGFEVVYNLASVLFPEGFGCVGERCPSSDHSNGDRDYTPHGETKHWHGSGGYALRQRWL